MIFALFHWTARKPTLIARPRLAGPRAAADAKRAPAQRRSRSRGPAPATTSGARLVASVSWHAPCREPTCQHQWPQRRRAGQEKDAGANCHGGWLHAHNAHRDERKRSDEPNRNIGDEHAEQDCGNRIHRFPPAATKSTTITSKTSAGFHNIHRDKFVICRKAGFVALLPVSRQSGEHRDDLALVDRCCCCCQLRGRGSHGCNGAAPSDKLRPNRQRQRSGRELLRLWWWLERRLANCAHDRQLPRQLQAWHDRDQSRRAAALSGARQWPG